MTRTVIDRAAFINGLQDRPREDVPLPELGEGAVVPVWGMTAGERTRFERSFTNKAGATVDARIQEFRERLVVACCRDDSGQPIFTSEDIATLATKRADVLERIVNVAQRLSGMSKTDIEETVGN
jgi:hypothetical protein